MSLTKALSTATSSLTAIEKQMAVVSENITNADTTGYTKKTVSVVNSVNSDGSSNGVSTTTESSTADQYLLKQLVSAISSESQASVTYQYYDMLQSYLGELSSSSSTSSSSDSNDLSSMLSSLESSLTELGDAANDSAYKSDVVSALDDVTSLLRQTSADVQSLRSEADQEITTTCDTVNNDLSTIATLNTQIAQIQAGNGSTADLEDERMSALEDLASNMGVSYYIDGNGEMQVYTSTGLSLVSNGNYSSLSHTAASSVSSSTSYSPTSSDGINGIYVAGKDITDTLTSGNLKALVDMRDSTLPTVQAELDNLSSSLSDTLNSIANLGSSYPPANTLTGTTSVSGSDSVTIASNSVVRLALTDSTGDLISSTYITLSGSSSGSETVSQIASDLSSMSGVTASVDSDGHLVLQATNSSNGVALTTVSGGLGSSEVGLSSYFGLNDVITDGSSAETISVNSTLLSDSSRLPTGELSGSDTLTVGLSAVAAGDGTIATLMADALSASQTFSAVASIGSASGSRGLSATTTGFSDYAADIIAGVATDYKSADSTYSTTQGTLSSLQNTWDSETGVNTDSETASLTTLQDAYAATAQVITTLRSMFTSLMDAVSG